MRLYHRFFGEHTRSLPWRPVPFALVAALVAAHARGADVNAMARSRSAALIEALQSRGMSCTEEDVTWLVGARGIDGAVVGGGRALVRASAHGEPTDLYLVEARLSPEGALLDVGTTWNITRTTGVDEARPLVRGAMAAFSTSVDGTAHLHSTRTSRASSAGRRRSPTCSRPGRRAASCTTRSPSTRSPRR
jgi:hypothetical protein